MSESSQQYKTHQQLMHSLSCNYTEVPALSYLLDMSQCDKTTRLVIQM